MEFEAIVITVGFPIIVGVASIAIISRMIMRRTPKHKESIERWCNMSPKERRLDDVQRKLHDFESDNYEYLHHRVEEFGAVAHAHTISMLEHKELVDRVREAETQVYGTPITPGVSDWSESL